jgi:hypothetical protein
MAVNLTSRVEAATKQFNLPLLVTAPTAKRLSNRFATHRICRAKMRGFDDPVDLYGVAPAPINGRSLAAWQSYQDALWHFEQGRLQDAAEQLASIDPAVSDVPSRFLLEHLQRELARQHRRRSTDKGSDNPDGVIVLNSK